MVSVLLLTVSMLTVALLVVRSSSREYQQAGALVARERALMAAQATIDLGATRYRTALEGDGGIVNGALTGMYVAGDPTQCESVDEDCIPGLGDAPATGQKNHLLGAGRSDCAGRPCMRQGAISFLADKDLAPIPWTQVPFADLLDGGDSEAVVSLWIRNNASDALGELGSGSWIEDDDGTVVLTAMATLRNTTVAIEQEVRLQPGAPIVPLQMASPDEGYGGGHNNDNSAVTVCRDDYVEYDGG
jgi:hypothetical protein